MKEVLFGVLAVLLLSTCPDLIHRHPADLGIALAAESNEHLQPLITTSELIVGENRFAFGLTKANKLLENADIRLRVYSIDGPEPHLIAETNALYYPLGAAEPGERLHRHADGTRHGHRAASDLRGLYVTRLEFAHPGPWGIELQARDHSGSLATARLTIAVSKAALTPALGSPGRAAAIGLPPIFLICATSTPVRDRILDYTQYGSPTPLPNENPSSSSSPLRNSAQAGCAAQWLISFDSYFLITTSESPLLTKKSGRISPAKRSFQVWKSGASYPSRGRLLWTGWNHTGEV